jgi:hypothetical protein
MGEIQLLSVGCCLEFRETESAPDRPSQRTTDSLGDEGDAVSVSRRLGERS